MDIQALTASLGADVAAFLGGVRQVIDSSQLMVEGFKQIGEAARQVEEALGAVAERAIEAGLETSNVASEFKNAFGDTAAAVEEWAGQVATATGNSTDDIQAVATKFEVMAKGMGVTREEATSMAQGLTQVATELQTVHHISLETAQADLAGALKGRALALKDLGIAIDASTQKQAALNAGFRQSFDELSEGTKARLNYNLVLEQSAGLEGKAAAAMVDPANQLRMMHAHLQDVWQDIGLKLLPAFTSLITKVDQLATWYANLDDSTRETLVHIGEVAGAMAAVAAAVSAVVVILPSLVAGFEAVGGMLEAIGIASAADLLPIIITVAAIAAGVAGLILIVHEFHKLWDAESGAVKSATSGIVDSIQSAFDRLTNWLPGWVKQIIVYVTQPWEAMKDAVFLAIEAQLKAFAAAASAVGLTDTASSIRSAAEGLDEVRQHFFQDMLSATKDGIATGAGKVWGVLESGAKQVGHEFSEAIDLDALVAKAKKFFQLPAAARANPKAGSDPDAAAAKALAEKRAKLNQDLVDTWRTVAKVHQGMVDEDTAAQAKQVAAALQERRDAATATTSAARQASDEALSALKSAYQSGSAAEISTAQRVAAEKLSAAEAAGNAEIDVIHQQEKSAQDILNQRKSTELDAANELAAQQAVYERTVQEAYQNGSADLIAASQEMKKDLDAAAEHLRAAHGATVKAAQDATDITKKGAKDEAEIRTKSAKDAADYLKANAQGLFDAIAAVGGKIGGITGSVTSAAAQGFAAAGPIGAAAGAAQSLIENSAGFKQLSDAINGVVQPIADAIGRFFGPLAGVVQKLGTALGPLFTAIGDITNALGGNLAAVLAPLVPIIAAVAGLLGELLEPVADLMVAVRPLMPIIVLLQEVLWAIQLVGFAPLIIALKLLGPAIEVVAKGIWYVVDGVATVWNGIIGAVEDVFRTLADISIAGVHPLGFLNDLADGLDGAKVKVDDFGSATDHATQIIHQLTEAQQQQLQSIMSMIQQQQEQAAVDQANVDALQQALDRAKATGSSQSDIDAIQQALTDAMGKQQADADQASVDYFQQLIKTQTDNGVDTSNTVLGLANALAKQAIDQAAAANANTTATDKNTQAVVDLTTALTNAPSGFVAAAYEVAAQTPSSGTGTGAGGGPRTPMQGAPPPGSGHVFNGDVTIQVVSNDPQSAWKAIDEALRKGAARTSGLPVMVGAGRFG